MSAPDRVCHEDLSLFLRTATTATGQATFYGSGGEEGLRFLHTYMAGNYRHLYARCLGAGINDHHRQRVITELLAAPAGKDPVEGALIAAALATLPTQRAYKALAALATRGVHNRRARAITREFLGSRQDLVFEAVKYRRLVRVVHKHFHLHPPGELAEFLFTAPSSRRRFSNPLLDRHRAAHFSKEAIFSLPFTVAEGFAGRRGVSRKDLLSRTQAQITALERLRLQRSADAEEVDLSIDLGRTPLTRLALYLLSRPAAWRQAHLAEAQAALQTAAHRALRRHPLPEGHIVAVLDRSASSVGARETHLRPLAVALGIDALLRAGCPSYQGFWTPGPGDDPMSTTLVTLEPTGTTQLAGPLLAALASRPAWVIVVSDGFENDPPGAVEGIARLYRAHLGDTRFVHVNPTYDGETLQPRPLAPAGPEGAEHLPTVGIRDAEDLPSILAVLNVSSPWGTPDMMTRWLEARAAALLAHHHVRPPGGPASDPTEPGA